MDKIKAFLVDQGLNDKEIAVYLGCLMQGEGTVLEISKQARIKRPTTYLILEDLVAKGLVNSKQDRKSIKYTPAHPKKIVTALRNQLDEAENIMPTLMSFYRDTSDKPTIAVYQDMNGYNLTGDWAREHVKNGGELLVYGNVKFFSKHAPDSADPWFKMMRNKKYRARILIYGQGDYVDEYIAMSAATKNPNLKIRVVADPTYPVHTETAILEDTVIQFTGGSKFFSAVMRSKNLADTFRTTFEQLWTLGEDI